MIVVLDLDYTLVNSASLKKELENRAAELGVTATQFSETYRDAALSIPGQYDYSVPRQAKILEERYGFDEQKLKEQMFTAFDILPALLYPDAVPFLTYLKEHNIPAILFTWANAEHQQEKVRRLNIAHFFSDMVFTQEAKAAATVEFPGDPSQWVFINDNPNELRALARRFPTARMLRIKRAEGKVFRPEDDALAVPTFANLQEVQEYLHL